MCIVIKLPTAKMQGICVSVRKTEREAHRHNLKFLKHQIKHSLLQDHYIEDIHVVQQECFALTLLRNLHFIERLCKYEYQRH